MVIIIKQNKYTPNIRFSSVEAKFKSLDANAVMHIHRNRNVRILKNGSRSKIPFDLVIA
jgi:hypothetical protein